MKVTVLYTFPLFGAMKRPLCTNLALGPDGVVGFGIKALPDMPLQELGKAASFQFFRINISTGQVIQSGLQPFPLGSLALLTLCYVEDHHVWLIGMNGSELFVSLLDANAREDQNASTRYVFDRTLAGIGDVSLTAMWLRQQSLFLLLNAVHPDEVSSDAVYVAQCQHSSPQSQTVQYLDECDVIRAYVNDDGVLLILCQRSGSSDQHEAGSDTPAGNWRIKVLALTPTGSIVQERFLPALGFPIKDPRFLRDDLDNWLDLRIRMIAGPRERTETCIARVRLQDTTRSTDPLAIQGGFYWISSQGEILQSAFAASLLESMCVCESRVIGVDLWHGERRLWYWPFSTSSEIFVAASFPSALRRVKVVAMEQDPQRFWCIEEYVDALRISQRDSKDFTEYASVVYQGVSLPATISEPYPNDADPQVALAYQDGLALLVLNKDQKLQLLYIQ